MSLRRQGPNEDRGILPATARACSLTWESLPLGRVALLAAALVMAYLVLSGTFSSGALARAADVPVGEAAPIIAATACDDAGYDATFLSPTVPSSSDTYTYVIDRCQPEQNESAAEIDFVKLSGCWEIEDVKNVQTSAGFVDMIPPGTIRVGGIDDDDMPLTIEIMFHLSLKSGGEERTWIWVHTGPGEDDGQTYVVGGPFCEEKTSTPSPTPSPTPIPTPSPTPSPTPTPVTDLTIVKTDSLDPVAIGDTLAYTVTVNNIGAITAVDVVVIDALPDDVSLISSTPSQGSCDGTTCQLGDIAAGEAAVISYVVVVNEGAQSPLLNTACVTSKTAEATVGDNCDDEETKLKTVLAATSPPDGLPATGGRSLDGGSAALPFLLLLGITLAVIGTIAGLAARRRATSK